MRKNLHHKIMLSILAGSLALGFVYAPPAFAEEDVTIEHGETYTAPDGTQGTYDLDADYDKDGTNYGDATNYTPITDFPEETITIGIFTVKAGNGGTAEKNGSTGGKGGSISLSDIKNAITNGVSITAGNGGYSELGTSTGVAGGDVTLTFKNVVTNNISLKSVTNGTEYGANSTPGNGGSVTFEAESIKALTADSQLWIIFNKNDGDIKFTANTLAVQNGTVIIAGSCTPADGSNNHINTLLLTGSGNIDVSDNIKIGSLTIDGGTIINNGVAHNSWQSIIKRDYNTTNTITIGTKGATFDIHDNLTNTLTKSVTGAGNLTKTGTGTLKLTGSTYDYSGLTVVEQGTIDASATTSTLSKSAGLTLYGGATFVANTDQDWYGNQLAVYDNGSDQYATYQGNLTATYSNLYFIASGDNTNPLLKVINNGTGNNGNVNIAGSNYNLGLTGDKFLEIGSKLTLIEADGTINADNLEPGSGIKVGSTIKQDITTNIEVSVDDSGSKEKLIATVSGALATDEASAINSGMLGGLAFNLQGTDLIRPREHGSSCPQCSA